MASFQRRRRPSTCIRGDYTPLVATLLTSTELETLTASMVAQLRPLPLVQREIVLEQLIGDDARIVSALLPALRRVYETKRERLQRLADSRHERRLATRGVAVLIRRDGVM